MIIRAMAGMVLAGALVFLLEQVDGSWAVAPDSVTYTIAG